MSSSLPPNAADAPLPPAFVPAEVEGPLYERWVERGYFESSPDRSGTPYAIVIPPPNVTGSLHLGHAFQHTLMDALTRRRRMQGFDAVWVPGMDHAGIATQTLVERQLATEGSSRQELGREAFVERVWQWKDEYGGRILGQMRRLGDGVAWSRERFTMDEGLSRAVGTIFKRLYDDGLIYRANRLVNWSPVLQSAISDIEVEYRDVEGELVSVRYGDGADSIVVATTRLETLLGDTAVAVHPDDERYAHLVGREIELPLTGRRIPVVADAHVDPEFGTGAVKVTPAHDPNDFAIAERHGLPALTILDERGAVTGTGTGFDGLDRAQARVAVREALREQGRVVAEKRPYVHSVGHSSRTGEAIEPRLSEQWFVRVETLAKASGDAVRDGRVAIRPATLEPRWFAWVDDMHDWCISRQLWWGHRIPVWYGPAGEVVCVGPDEQPPSGEGWHQDPDVLDTWFSSALWPFSVFGWPDRTADLERYYPTSVLVTGYDILFFWVARMMMFGLYANDGVPPFRTIALTGLIRDAAGKKMSKSHGNVVDPLVWMDAYGSDAVRFTVANSANPGQDVPVGEQAVQSARNFCTKLWNATRFALINGATTAQPLPPAELLGTADRWILSRLQQVVAEVDAAYEDYQFARATELLYHFAWDEFCDWYVELAKVPLARDDESSQATRLVLGHVLDALLRLLHPVTPFLTEALWTTLTGGESVVVATWPTTDAARVDDDAERQVGLLREVVTEVRRFRAEQGVRPTARIPAGFAGLEASPLLPLEPYLRTLARLEPLDAAPTASLEVAGLTVEVDLSQAVDVAAERARLGRDLAAAQKEAAQCRGKLGNAAFVDRAPAPVVDKVRLRAEAAEADIARIEAQLERLSAGATA